MILYNAEAINVIDFQYQNNTNKWCLYLVFNYSLNWVSLAYLLSENRLNTHSFGHWKLWTVGYLSTAGLAWQRCYKELPANSRPIIAATELPKWDNFINTTSDALPDSQLSPIFTAGELISNEDRAARMSSCEIDVAFFVSKKDL